MTNNLLTQAEVDLHTYIVDVYPRLDQSFSTSWTNYAMCPTDVEQLLYAWLQIGDDYPDSPNHDLDWFKAVPSLLFDLAIKAGANTFQTEDGDYAWMEAYAKFAGDFMQDSFYCHLRDY